MSLLTIPLGGFNLHRMIGVGGAGEVWQGVHGPTDVPVAVKVITAQRARDPKYRESFRNEVAAVAGLDHPGVVMVFDYGEVDKGAEKASMGRMVAGSPFLAMELARRGSLATDRLLPTWQTLKARMVWLLDVLAHAHSMGVIHRDLKPGNVLLFDDPAVPGDPLGASRLRLTDFGLAHAVHRDDRTSKGTSGTPVFMAPEQFRGQWRDFGPWTDLYSFGCMAFELASGRPPFTSHGIYSLMQDHLFTAVPEITPRLPLPQGFEAWVRRLMHKEPAGRYQRAADAAYALLELGDPEEQEGAGEFVEQEVAEDPQLRPTSIIGHTLMKSWPDWEQQWREERRKQGNVVVQPLDDARLADRVVPPLPETWRIERAVRPNLQLLGAGLGLYGMRALPLVSRSTERDVLWDALKTVRRRGGVQAVVLSGAAGVGKSRLAEWLAQRADELGSAVVLRATHSDGAGPNDGLSRMVATAAGCVRLPREEMRHRLQAWHERREVTDPYEWNALMELIWPSRPEEAREGVVRFGAADERYALIHRFVCRLAGGLDDQGARRPVVLWLDDVQWGSDALGLADYLLRIADLAPEPVLVICTVRDEGLESRPTEKALLDEVVGHVACQFIRLEPLTQDENRELIRSLLHLQGELAAQVEARTAGNPLFAVQLVGDWVERGVLEVGETGFRLRSGDEAILPDDIHQLWTARLRDVLRDHPEAARTALEVGAIMGTDVDPTEWKAACRVAGLAVPDDLLDSLAARRLVRLDPRGGWSFAHGMLRESVQRMAAESVDCDKLHLACATVLQIRYDVANEPGIAERLGRHLFHGGQLREALEPLRRGANERKATSDYASTIRLLELEEQVLQALELDPSDRRWGQCGVLRAELLIGQGKLEQAEARALEVVESATRYGWDRLKAAALRHAASVAAKQGSLKLAEKRLKLAERAAKSAGSETEIARVLLFLGEVTRLRGETDQAARLCRRALARFQVLDDIRGQADTYVGLAHVHRMQGDLDETEAMIRQCIPLFERIGARFGIGAALNTLGDVLRVRGQLQEAATSYREAESLLRSIGSPENFVPLLNLGLVQLARKEFGEARKSFEELLSAMVHTGRRGLEGALRAFLLPCLVHAGDTQGFEDQADAAQTCLESTGFVDSDIAEAMELAAELAVERNEPRLAVRALELAANQWRGLKNDDREGQVMARHARLAPGGL